MLRMKGVPVPPECLSMKLRKERNSSRRLNVTAYSLNHLEERTVIITQDKDFNVELVRIVKPPGIILLRTFGTKIEERIKILLSVLENKQKELYRHIIVVEKKENAVKVRLRSI